MPTLDDMIMAALDRARELREAPEKARKAALQDKIRKDRLLEEDEEGKIWLVGMADGRGGAYTLQVYNKFLALIKAKDRQKAQRIALHKYGNLAYVVEDCNGVIAGLKA